ncbi:MAG: hypothetical protein ACYSRZ_09390 [Planctomycetota bacterium]
MNKAFIEREKAKKRMKRYRSRVSDADVTQDVTAHSSSSSSSSNIYTLQQVKDSGFLAGVSEQQSEEWYNHFKAQGFVFGNGQPITDLPAALVRWRNNQYKFKDNKQKTETGVERLERIKQDDRARSS